METRMTLAEAWALADAMVKAQQQGALPTRFGFALAVTRRRFEPVLAAMEEQRQQLLAKFAVRDGQGQMIVGEDGHYRLFNQDGFQAAWKRLLSEEVEVRLHQVPLEAWPEAMDPALVDALLPLCAEAPPELRRAAAGGGG